MPTLIVIAIVSYLIGSLSSAIIICKALNLPDPRTEGSMNPGTTNVLRIGGKTPALITLAGDALKGFIPVFIAHLIGISGFWLGIIGLAAFIGHLYPIFFKFQGGKGVATAFGAILAMAPIVAIGAFIVWLIVIAITRYASLAAMVAAAAAVILVLFFASDKAIFLPVLIMVVLLIWRHSANIHRLKAGTESKVSF